MRVTTTQAVSLMSLAHLPSGIHVPPTSSHASRVHAPTASHASRAQMEVSS
jgi:hypothetical protein